MWTHDCCYLTQHNVFKASGSCARINISSHLQLNIIPLCGQATFYLFMDNFLRQSLGFSPNVFLVALFPFKQVSGFQSIFSEKSFGRTENKGSLQEFLVFASKNSLSRIRFEKGVSTLDQRGALKDISLSPPSAMGRQYVPGEEWFCWGCRYGGFQPPQRFQTPYLAQKPHKVAGPKETMCLSGDLCGR